VRSLGTFAFGIIFMASSSLGCQEEQASIDLAPSGAGDAGVRADAGRVADGSMARMDATMPKDNQPYIAAAGIGVTDLEVSAEFYEDVLGLSFEYELTTTSWREKVFSDVRGNNVVLMDYVRERNTKKNPVKLVFAVKNLAEAYDAVLAGGGTSVAPPSKFGETNVALTYDPDQYLVELIEAPSVPSNVLVGMGIGVSSLDDSADFYTRVVGLQFRRDIDVPGFMDEKELGSYQMKGPALVLMHYEDEQRTYKDIPAKVVFGVSDAARFATAIEREDESKIVAAPMVYGDSGLTVGMAKDLEGYLVEFLQATRSAP
jgi:lactoylglutathione lyase